MTFPPSLHPNSFSFPSFDLNIFFLQCKQSSSLFLSVESAISKRLEGLKFVNFLGAAPLDPSLGCAVSPSCFTRPPRGLADSTSCYPRSHIYLAPPPPPSLAPLTTALQMAKKLRSSLFMTCYCMPSIICKHVPQMCTF